MIQKDDEVGHAFSSDDVCRVVGERVRDSRRALGFTMAQFAEVAEISLGMVSKIEPVSYTHLTLPTTPYV